MATLQTTSNGKSPAAFIKIDMTPMVDLGFLLITFFIFTTTLSQPKATELFMPKDGTPMPVKQSTTITVMPVQHNLYCVYYGLFEEALANKAFVTTDKDGLRRLLQAKQQSMGKSKSLLLIVIKPANEALYANVVAVLDEVLINKITKYAIAPLTNKEEAFLKKTS